MYYYYPLSMTNCNVAESSVILLALRSLSTFAGSTVAEMQSEAATYPLETLRSPVLLISAVTGAIYIIAVIFQPICTHDVSEDLLTFVSPGIRYTPAV